MLKLPKPFTLQKEKKKIKQQRGTNPVTWDRTTQEGHYVAFKPVVRLGMETKKPCHQLIGQAWYTSRDRLDPHQLPYKEGSEVWKHWSLP